MLVCNALAIYFFRNSQHIIHFKLFAVWLQHYTMFHQIEENIILHFVFTIKMFIFLILKLLIKNKN